MLQTARLTLRRWRDADRDPFAALNADPEVMRFFKQPLTRAESDELVEKIHKHFDQYGWGLWAVDAPQLGFIGFVGMVWQRFPAHFTPAVEIGWRLARPAWGKGYATEAAIAVRDFAFRPEAVPAGSTVLDGGDDVDAAGGGVGLTDLVSITTRTNLPSQAVMRRIGMTCDPADDFLHPSLPDGHPLADHVLHRMHAPQ